MIPVVACTCVYILSCFLPKARLTHVQQRANGPGLVQVHASGSKAMRSSLGGSDGSGTNGAKNRSEATGANLAFLGGRPEDSPSRDSISLQHKVYLGIPRKYCFLLNAQC